MKAFRIRFYCTRRRGFSLVEATLSLGFLSFGFLSLVPLLAFGLKTARQARDNRATAQIAQTLIEEARQGTLPSGQLSLIFKVILAPPPRPSTPRKRRRPRSPRVPAVHRA